MATSHSDHSAHHHAHGQHHGGGGHGHRHGHHHDRGLKAAVGYLRLLPRMWRSELNEAVVRELELQPGESVVDLGAGVGAASVQAADRGARVLAVDPMPLMRRVLSVRRLRHLARGVITVRDGAAEAIPSADASVDAAWTVNTLHHWTDRNAAARELARVLKPGARVLLVDEDVRDPSHPEHERYSRSHRVRDFDEVDPEELANALTAAGFAQARGERSRIAGRPVRCVRATR